MTELFSLLIKPASADCNLRCGYCFYLDRSALYPATPVHRMDDAVLEQMIRTFLALPFPSHRLTFQGGEPLLMGEGFYSRVFLLQRLYARPGGEVVTGMQTNGTLLTDGLAALLAREGSLTGVSVDGPAELHDRYRCRIDGSGSHAAVVAGIERLRKAGAPFNVLTLVSAANVAEPERVYDYLRDELGVLFHQYIPCVEQLPDGAPAPYAVSAEGWGAFLCRLFDRWYLQDTRRVSVRLFDDLLNKLVDGVDTSCTGGMSCRNYLVVEHNGDVYPCDFYVTPELRLGNIMEQSWDELWNAPACIAFGRRKRLWASVCERCSYLTLCRGDCPKNRLIVPGEATHRPSRLCVGWKRFYAHALPRLEELAQDIRRARRQQLSGVPASAVGRNDRCPCGSGRKFKSCCGRN